MGDGTEGCANKDVSLHERVDYLDGDGSACTTGSAEVVPGTDDTVPRTGFSMRVHYSGDHRAVGDNALVDGTFVELFSGHRVAALCKSGDDSGADDGSHGDAGIAHLVQECTHGSDVCARSEAVEDDAVDV